MQITGGTVTLRNINFINAFYNDDNYNFGAALTVNNAKVIIENCTFSNSVGPYGAVYLQGNNAEVYNSKFINNTGTSELNSLNYYGRFGGAIHWEGNDGLIKNSQFVSNKAFMGGAIHWEGNNGNIDNVIFYNNSASYHGGAVYVHGKWDRARNIKDYANNFNIKNSIFVENNAGEDAGGLYFTQMSSNSNANNVSFQRNTASIGGGAVLDGNKNSITNSEFISNFARYGGGGVVEQGFNTMIDHCIIYNNTATTYGGGVNINTGTIINSIVENNNAIVGAGVYTLEGIINNVTFIHNNGTLGQDISVVNQTSIINSNYDYIYYHNLTQQLSVHPAQSDVDGYLKVENGIMDFV